MARHGSLDRFGKHLRFFVGRLATAELKFRSAMVKFRTRASYWVAQRQIDSYLQCFDFDMCAVSILSFVAQSFVLRPSFLKEVHDYALKLMLGPCAWFHCPRDTLTSALRQTSI